MCDSVQRYRVKDNGFTNRVTCDPPALGGKFTENSECGKHMCKCDEELAYELSQAAHGMSNQYVAWDGMGWNGMEWEGSGPFDHAQCRAPSASTGGSGNGAGLGPGDTRCCGDYPKRVTYISTKHECCSGFLSDIGTCQT